MVLIKESDGGTKKLVIKKLEEFRRELSPKLHMELDRVWNQVWMDAIDMCPVITGTLVSTIKIVEGGLGGIVSGGIKQLMVIDKTIMAGDVNLINPKSGMPCIYAILVHDGHRTRSGSWVAGQPFLADAIMKNEAAIMAACNKALKELGIKYETHC